jgi:hypothetical protein
MGLIRNMDVVGHFRLRLNENVSAANLYHCGAFVGPCVPSLRLLAFSDLAQVPAARSEYLMQVPGSEITHVRIFAHPAKRPPVWK